MWRGRAGAPLLAAAPAICARLIDRTRFAISTEETRYYLNGIYLHATAKGERQCRAARGRDRRPSAGAGRDAAAARRREMPGVIVPRKTVTECAS